MTCHVPRTTFRCLQRCQNHAALLSAVARDMQKRRDGGCRARLGSSRPEMGQKAERPRAARAVRWLRGAPKDRVP